MNQVGANSNEKLVAFIIKYYSHADNSVDVSKGVMWKTLFNSDNAYNVPNISITGHVCRTNLASNTAFRGSGGAQAIIVIENIMDRLAVKLDMDISEVCLVAK